MKFLLSLSVMVLSATAFANHTPYKWLTCKSETVKLKAYTESCIGGVAVSEAGKDSFAIEKNCQESEDKLSMEVEFKKPDGSGYNQFFVSAEDGERGVLVVGHFDELIYSDKTMKVYKGSGDAYLSGEKLNVDSRVHKNVQCELELNLWP